MTSGLMGIRNNLPYNIRPTGQAPFRMVYGRIHPTYFLAASSLGERLLLKSRAPLVLTHSSQSHTS